jgi:preprotein translocase subunit SecA
MFSLLLRCAVVIALGRVIREEAVLEEASTRIEEYQGIDVQFGGNASAQREMIEIRTGISEDASEMQFTGVVEKTRDEIIAEYLQLNPELDKSAERTRIVRRLVLIDVMLKKTDGDFERAWLHPESREVTTGVTDKKKKAREKRVCNRLLRVSTAVKTAKGFYPRIPQLLAVLLYIEGTKNVLTEIGTGQGKTLIAAMTAIARVGVFRERVAILVPTEPLAVSGATDLRGVYEAAGVSVAYFNGRTFTPAGASYDVVYATPFGLESDKNTFNRQKQTAEAPSTPLRSFWESSSSKFSRFREIVAKKTGKNTKDIAVRTAEKN